MRRHLRHAALAGAAVLAALAVACGSGKDDKETVVPQPSVPPLPTRAVDPFDEPLTPVTSQSGLYTMQIPAGWVAQGIGETNDETFTFSEKDLLRAEVGVTCEPIITRDDKPWTALDYLQRDLGFLERLSGVASVEIGSQSQVTVDGESGIEVSYTATFSGIAIRQEAIYFIKRDCAWILRLRIFAPGDAGDYAILFRRMVGSFRML